MSVLYRRAERLRIQEQTQRRIAEDHLEPYGHFKAKVSLPYLDSLKGKKNGKLILVTAMTPTPAGEGKTTTSVGLTQAMGRIGKRVFLCIRQPSMGPTFGIKGGFDAGVKFYDALNLFVRLVNIGDVKSLAAHPASTTHRQLSKEELETAGVTPDMIRLCIGIEDIEDIIADLEQALASSA